MQTILQCSKIFVFHAYIFICAFEFRTFFFSAKLRHLEIWSIENAVFGFVLKLLSFFQNDFGIWWWCQLVFPWAILNFQLKPNGWQNTLQLIDFVCSKWLAKNAKYRFYNRIVRECERLYYWNLSWVAVTSIELEALRFNKEQLDLQVFRTRVIQLKIFLMLL